MTGNKIARTVEYFTGFLMIAGAFFVASAAYAGAWTQKEGVLQSITSLSTYRATKFLDAQGNKQPQLAYTKQELAQYAEYGLRDDITLGGQLRLVHTLQDTASGDDSADNLGDTDLFVRKRLWRDDFSVISLQPGVTLPSPDDRTTTPKIGSDHPVYSLRASYGRGFKLYDQLHYADITGGYLHRAGTPDDQLVLDTTVGLNLTEHWQIVPQLFITQGRHSIQTSSFTESSSNDYNLVKGQFSVQYTTASYGAFQLGVFSHLTGKNTGQGKGALVSYIRNFE
ncbi:MAG: hypothetical protein SFX19_03425 [Alphaproteobacteria bacterium]|nr:hypothetical protein [Alphaproteobacteria bacterium]